jgi:very-short-patch-repair endonuclease
MELFIRICSKCGCLIEYKNQIVYKRAIKKNSNCKKCCQKGKFVSIITKNKMRISAPNRMGNKNPMFGKKSAIRGKKWEDFRSKKSIKKQKKQLKKGNFKGYKHKEESKIKIGNSVRGKKNGFYGRKHTTKTKNKIREKVVKQYQKGKTKGVGTSIERIMEEMLHELRVAYSKQFRVKFWLFDFYLPMHNIMIECDGDYWHANPLFYKRKNLNATQRKNVGNDKRKNSYLKKNKVPLLRFWENDLKNNRETVLDRLKLAFGRL